jgi:hypothetical protein
MVSLVHEVKNNGRYSITGVDREKPSATMRMQDNSDKRLFSGKLERNWSGQRESNPHHQLGRLR